jgi:hypothetical protein
MARTISYLLNNIVLGLDRILNKALKTYRLLIIRARRGFKEDLK